MKILLDTHILVWWIGNPALVPNSIRTAVADGSNMVYVSAVSAWEIAYKTSLSRLDFPNAFLDDFDRSLAAMSFSPLSLSASHAVVAGRLDAVHKDPFDRLIAGQAICEGMMIATVDAAMRTMGVSVIT
jgi:PIN domain nuclease of toxin-antitoxin system